MVRRTLREPKLVLEKGRILNEENLRGSEDKRELLTV
jgi:hypothetical protein